MATVVSGPTDHELSVPLAHEEEVECTGVRADGDVELQLTDGRRYFIARRRSCRISTAADTAWRA